MRKGEHAKFTVAPQFAHGDDGSGEEGSPQHVPPGSVVILEIELIKCPMREDLFEDGGVIKLEQTNGPDGRQPRAGDECQISYKVTVEGAGVVMASQQAVYKLGSEQMGQIAKVLDKALGTMKRGDEALLTCQPSYTFGNEGRHGGKVASVFLALEQIYEVHDTSVGLKDRAVLRKRIRESDTNDRVYDTARVVVQVKSVTASGGEKALREPRELSFVVGNGDVCDALEGSVIQMKQGEEAVLRCESSEAVAGGSLGLPEGLPTPVMIHIAVVRFEKVPEKWDLDSHGRVARGRERKEVATALFKRGRIRLACHLYELIADLFARLEFFKSEDQNEAAELRRVATLNRAMCMLKLGNMKVVKELCSVVLREDATNAKALFRRAKAHVSLKEYDEAIHDLQRLLEVEPASKEGRALMQEARQLRKQRDQQQSGAFAKMCAGLGQLPERVGRTDDSPVVMPNLEEEYAKIAARHGLPYKGPSRRPEVVRAEEVEHATVTAAQ